MRRVDIVHVLSTGLLRKPAAALSLAILALFAQAAFAQTPCPGVDCLSFFKNYSVTGDYVVGGVGLRGLGDATGFATGTITIPDPNTLTMFVPDGADVVVSLLYWQTVEKTQSAFAGQNGFFNGYAIVGTSLGNPNAPTSWSGGGCGGNSQGTTTLRTYRADVRPFLPVVGGKHQGNGSFQVRLADSGSGGGGTPLTLGATLVIIYRLSIPPTSTTPPPAPQTLISIYDGAFAPSNSSSSMSQTMKGFYQAGATPLVKHTQMVGNGQTNKFQLVSLNGQNLPSLYPGLPPFPGHYNDSWDNPTWSNVNQYGNVVQANDSSATTSVVPTQSNSGCVSWAGMIFSSTVLTGDGDGLLPVWKTSQGYTDVKDGTPVPLPGANDATKKHLYVQIDYMCSIVTGGACDPSGHVHLPKQAALDMVGDAFWAQNIHVHFDVGNNYQTPWTAPCGLPARALCDPYIIPASSASGGNIIAESAVTCTDNTAATPPFYCQFPGEAATSWKGGFTFLKHQPINYPDEASCQAAGSACIRRFQHNRRHSHHEVIFGHALGRATTRWSVGGASPMLIKIVNTGSTATVTTSMAHGLSTGARVSVSGAIADFDLNGTYLVQSASTYTFTIITTNVTNGTYEKNGNPGLPANPGLAVSFGPATSHSGWSDVGGADSIVTFGKWHWDDPTGCIANPTVPLALGEVYCNDQVGTVQAQAGTLMHELGHTLGLTHGGAYIAPFSTGIKTTYGPNCKSNFLTIMNYAFQFHGGGLPGYDGAGHVNYSGQVLPVDCPVGAPPLASLNEGSLDESKGIGNPTATACSTSSGINSYRTRWFAPLSTLDSVLNTAVGGLAATIHCDGTPLTNAEIGTRVLVEGPLAPGAIDWNNNGIIDPVPPTFALDINFNGKFDDGSTLDLPPLQGFNDWFNIDMRQIGARGGVLGFSADAGDNPADFGGDNPADFGGDNAAEFGGDNPADFGGDNPADFGGDVPETDFDLANSTVDPPIALTCTNCVKSSVPWVEKGKSVPLAWTPPGFGQIRTYYIWRANITNAPMSATNKPVNIDKVTGTPSTPAPTPAFTDGTVKNNNTYLYFVTAALGAASGKNSGNQSRPSNKVSVAVKF